MTISRRKFLIDLSLATAGLSMPGIVKGSIGQVHYKRLMGRESEFNSLAEIDISEIDFSNVPEITRPWVYYWWLKGNVTKELITRDLEEMKKKGIGGFLLYDSRNYHDGYYNGIIPVPLHIKLDFMSSQWREMVHFTMQEAKRLGLKMSMNISNSGGKLSGPWGLEEEGPKKIIWTAVSVKGPKNINMELKPPQDKEYFRDVALMAIKLKKTSKSAEIKVDLNGSWNEVVESTQKAIHSTGSIIDLENNVRDGELYWEVPEGRWRIVRFGASVVGKPGDVDVLNERVVKKYFNLMGKEILKDAGTLKGDVLTHLYNCSWEGAGPDWTTGFEKEFLYYRGYDMHPYMVMLTGVIMKNKKAHKKFMNDYYKTIGDCFKNNCYETVGKLCHEAGVNWHSENGGPWRNYSMYRQSDELTFWGTNDMPQGEFWCSSTKDLVKRTNIFYDASAAHIYGKPLVAAEAFTSMTYHWTHYPAYLKQFADSNFINGANFFIWHTFTASPLDIGKPGFEYFAGTHINPNVTWFDKAGPFFKYIGRSQYLLRQGQNVSDVCCYISYKNYNEWGRGKTWNEKSDLSLKAGYCYDLLDTKVLVNELTFKDGKLRLPSGMAYRILVLDLKSHEIPLEAIKKIIQLVREGATIVLGQKVPDQTPGLKDYSKEDQDVVNLANQLWGKNHKNFKEKSLGKGKVYFNTTLQKVLKRNRILPDFEGPFEFVHRSDSQKDIYFLAGNGSGKCIFRINGRRPEVWNPINGKVEEIFNYTFTKDGRTVVPIDLPENGSTFIVFRKEEHKNHFISIKGPEIPHLSLQKNNSCKITSWKNGEFTLTDTNDKQQKIRVKTEKPMELKGPWEVVFQPAVGGNDIKRTFKVLKPWNEHKDPEIKYFSGNGHYRITFELTTNQIRYPARLKLGQVFDIAQVWINKKDLGIVWTDPWSIALSGVLSEGTNQLEIEVTNCWRNRLIGDAMLPKEKRKTQTNVRLVADRSQYKKAYEAYSAGDPLSPSGLLGPVFIEFGKAQYLTL